MSAPRAAMPAHRVVDTPLGAVLATHRGMTLYTFANDTTPGMAMCRDACSANWPPLVALNDAVPTGKWSLVQRTDGLKQWAYDGKPLYGWHEDKKAGDTLGEGKLNGAWHVARP
jgi:predicted lipoprotein with Yx(FWY)xxD motif